MLHPFSHLNASSLQSFGSAPYSDLLSLNVEKPIHTMINASSRASFIHHETYHDGDISMHITSTQPADRPLHIRFSWPSVLTMLSIFLALALPELM